MPSAVMEYVGHRQEAPQFLTTPGQRAHLLRLRDAEILTESQIRAIRKQMNASPTFARLVLNVMSRRSELIRLTPEHNAKGKEWLVRQWWTPRGRFRRNSPYLPYMFHTVARFPDHFALVKFINVNGRRTSSAANWQPVWRVFGGGREFDYYLNARGAFVIVSQPFTLYV